MFPLTSVIIKITILIFGRSITNIIAKEDVWVYIEDNLQGVYEILKVFVTKYAIS